MKRKTYQPPYTEVVAALPRVGFCTVSTTRYVSGLGDDKPVLDDSDEESDDETLARHFNIWDADWQ